MNKTQLESIRLKINEIKALIAQAREGSSDVQEKLGALEEVILHELKGMVWNEYETAWKALPQSP